MMKFSNYTLILLSILAIYSCKKGCPDENAINYDETAKRSDGSCLYEIKFDVPDDYEFTDSSGNNTVEFQDQTDLLDQIADMKNYMISGVNSPIDDADLEDMFENFNGNGNGFFSFYSDVNLRSFCIADEISQIEEGFDSLEVASANNNMTASNGQSGVISGSNNSYLLNANGFDYAELIEKKLLGTVIMHLALNEYFGDQLTNADNNSLVDTNYYTEMEHIFDQAFGLFGVPKNFPEDLGLDRFWGQLCNLHDGELESNETMMYNFRLGRAAITAKDYEIRDATVETIRKEWEKICAEEAKYYFELAESYYSTDQAEFHFAMTNAYAYADILRHFPEETREMNDSQVDNLLQPFDNLYNVTLEDIQDALSSLEAKY